MQYSPESFLLHSAMAIYSQTAMFYKTGHSPHAGCPPCPKHMPKFGHWFWGRLAERVQAFGR
jgi:hypothetical protein